MNDEEGEKKKVSVSTMMLESVQVDTFVCDEWNVDEHGNLFIMDDDELIAYYSSTFLIRAITLL